MSQESVRGFQVEVSGGSRPFYPSVRLPVTIAVSPLISGENDGLISMGRGVSVCLTVAMWSLYLQTFENASALQR